MLSKIKYVLLILGIITSTATLISKIGEIQAQTVDPELKQLLDQAKSLVSVSTNDNYKDKVYSPPSNTKKGSGISAINKQKIIQVYPIQTNFVLR